MQQTSFQTCRSLLLLLLLFVCGALSFSRANCLGFSSSNTLFPAPPGVCVVTFNYLRMLAPDGEMRCDAILSRTVARAMLSPFLHWFRWPAQPSSLEAVGGDGWQKGGCSPVKAKAEPKSKGPINFERHKICWQRHKNSHSGSWRLYPPKTPFGHTVPTPLPLWLDSHPFPTRSDKRIKLTQRKRRRCSHLSSRYVISFWQLQQKIYLILFVWLKANTQTDAGEIAAFWCLTDCPHKTYTYLSFNSPPSEWFLTQLRNPILSKTSVGGQIDLATLCVTCAKSIECEGDDYCRRAEYHSFILLLRRTLDVDAPQEFA